MLFKKIKKQFKQVLQSFDSYVEEHIGTALKVTTQLKRILSSPTADIITAIIPGNVDNVLQTQIVAALGKAIEALSIAEYCKNCRDVNEQLKCFTEQLRKYDPNMQDAILQKLASLLTSHLDGKRLKQSLYDLYTQAEYAAKK